MADTLQTQNLYWKLLLFICLFFLQSCGFKEPIPECDNPATCKLIEIAPGPEDFVLADEGQSPRLLISTRERRGEEKVGDIYSFDLNTRKVKKMNRSGDENVIKSLAHMEWISGMRTAGHYCT